MKPHTAVFGLLLLILFCTTTSAFAVDEPIPAPPQTPQEQRALVHQIKRDYGKANRGSIGVELVVGLPTDG